jgi:plasmid maintenance system killer protein
VSAGNALPLCIIFSPCPANVTDGLGRSQGKALPVALHFSELGVRISFPDAKTQRVFNDYDQLEAHFGAQLAAQIATRMAVLAAAKDLERVPRRPPIRLRALKDSSGQFSVDLMAPHRLRFGVVDSHAGIDKKEKDNVDRTRIEEIEVFGVE